MPGKQEKKFLKKKEREKKVRRQLDLMRTAAAKVAKQNKLAEEIEKKSGNFSQFHKADELRKLPIDTLEQIRRNVDILKALEAEYELEKSAKAKLNEELEEAGQLTLNQKLEYIQKNTANQAHLAELENVQCVGVSLVPPPPPKDVAEVSVLKASVEV